MTRIKKSHIEKDVYEATIGFLNAKKDSMTLHLHVRTTIRRLQI